MTEVTLTRRAKTTLVEQLSVRRSRAGCVRGGKTWAGVIRPVGIKAE